jgi:hypothetical protein
MGHNAGQRDTSFCQLHGWLAKHAQDGATTRLPGPGPRPHVQALKHNVRRYSRDVNHADLRRENCAVARTPLGHAERCVCVIAHQAFDGARRSPVSRRSEEP